jgi:uncharacterized protein (DUF433 family)
MNMRAQPNPELAYKGLGSYRAAEAARLVKLNARQISRWLRGYGHQASGQSRTVPPLWQPQYEAGTKEALEIGFRDLVELRFVKGFLNAGVSLQAVRSCLNYAQALVNDERPFSTRRFQTDGRTIFLESVTNDGKSELLDLKHRQFAIKTVIEQTFKDLDIEEDAVARWRPFGGKPTIVIDPQRSFGQPIAAHSGIPTVVLAEAVQAEGSEERVARLFDVPVAIVHDAARFEKALAAA